MTFDPLMLLIAIPLWGAFDRVWGSVENGRAVVIALSLALAAGTFFWVSPAVCLMVLTWPLYRSIGFVPGAMCPVNPAEKLAAFVRHVPVVPLAIAAATWGKLNPILPAVIFSGYTLAATGLAFWYGEKVRKARNRGVSIGDENAFVEIARGCAYGVALYALALIA